MDSQFKKGSPKLGVTNRNPATADRTMPTIPIVHTDYELLRTGLVKMLLMTMHGRREASHDILDSLFDQLEASSTAPALDGTEISARIIEGLDKTFGNTSFKRIKALIVETED